MKTLSLLLFSLVIIQTGFCQITITNVDMPVVNDKITVSTTSNQWSIDATQTGNNFLWDFSFLTEQFSTVDTFATVGSTPFAYQYYFNNNILYPDHKADYARKGMDFDLMGFFTVSKVYDFFKNNNNQYKNVGFGANVNGLPMSVRNIPIDTVYQFPLTNGSSYSSYSEYEINVPNTFYFQERKTVSQAIVDGYGTVITPLGTFPCIRVKLLIDIEDTVYVNSFNYGGKIARPTETQYHWLANGMKEPVLQINSTGGNITTIRYQDVVNVGISENFINGELSIYPNPAQQFVMVETGQVSGKISIYDLSGKVVYAKTYATGSEKVLLDLGTVTNGQYIIKLENEKGCWTNKLVVQH